MHTSYKKENAPNYRLSETKIHTNRTWHQKRSQNTGFDNSWKTENQSTVDLRTSQRPLQQVHLSLLNITGLHYVRNAMPDGKANRSSNHDNKSAGEIAIHPGKTSTQNYKHIRNFISASRTNTPGFGNKHLFGQIYATVLRLNQY